MTPSLYNSPFYLLEVSVRDASEAIIDRAESLGLIEELDKCMDLQNQLLNLNARLRHEIAWLPGIAPNKAISLIESLKLRSLDIYKDISFISQANLTSSYIEMHADKLNTEESIKVINHLAKLVDEINLEEVQNLINEDRRLSKFPEITDIEKIKLEFEDRKKSYVTTLENFLNELDSINLLNIVTATVDQLTNSGTILAPELIYKLIERYEQLTDALLDQEKNKVLALIDKIKNIYKEPTSEADKEIKELIALVKNWDKIAQPIQVAFQSQSIEHEVSRNLALKIRNLAVHIFNITRSKTTPNKLNILIKEVFQELPQVFQKSQEDEEEIKKIIKKEKPATMLGRLRGYLFIYGLILIIWLISQLDP